MLVGYRVRVPKTPALPQGFRYPRRDTISSRVLEAGENGGREASGSERERGGMGGWKLRHQSITGITS